MSDTSLYSRAEAFAQAIEDLPEDDEQAVLDLVNTHELTYEEFRLLDEQPGRFYIGGDYRNREWHRRLRVVRNNPSNDLFDRLRRS